MIFSMFIRNRVCLAGILRSNGLRRPFTLIPSTMLHVNARQVISKVDSNQVEKIQKSPAQIPRHFSTSKALGAPNGNYPFIWKMERFLALSMLGILPTIFFIESKTLESILAVAISIHTLEGMKAIMEDYARRMFGPAVTRALNGMVHLLFLLILAGLLNIIHNDVGLANTLKLIWLVDDIGLVKEKMAEIKRDKV